MKKLLFAMCCALLVYGCAQEPAEVPAPQNDPTTEAPETRGLSPLLGNFTESLAGGTLSGPAAGSVLSRNTAYTFAFTPPSSTQFRVGAMSFETSIGIRKVGAADYNPYASLPYSPGSSPNASAIELRGHIFTEPGQYEIKGNVSYMYVGTVNGVPGILEGEMFVSRTYTVEGIMPGRISGDQTVAPGAVPRMLTSLEAASGASSIAYLWQRSTDNYNWTNISGATSLTYTPAALTQTTYFRRRATAGSQTVYSNVVTATVQTTQLNAGYYTGDREQVIRPGQTPSTIVVSGASGGDGPGTYTYQWERYYYPTPYTYSGGYWSIIIGATGTGVNYSPVANEKAIRYRRKVTSGYQTAYTSEYLVAVIETPVLKISTPMQSVKPGYTGLYFNVTNPMFPWLFDNNIVYEWRTNGTVNGSPYPASSSTICLDVPANLDRSEYYFTLQCRVSAGGLTSDWSQELRIPIDWY